MAQMTVAQLRKRAVTELAQRKTASPTQDDLTAARHVMNCFYSLCGMEERLLYWENDERTYNKPYTLETAARRDRSYERINATLKREYSAHLVYFGYLPTICADGTTNDLYLRHLYR